MTSKVKVNTIETESGSTLTLGQSGDTVTLASGASQSGFGRTGTVDWDTTAKTASFTAVSGDGYFVNTTSSAITVTLPAGSAGSIVSLKDYANTWQTNNVTVTPDGTDKINGVNGDATLNTQDQSVTLVYVDSTKGWRVVQDSTSSVDGVEFITATGGTVTTCGNFKIHTFTSPGTFCVTAGSGGLAVADYLVVAGGGGGGENRGGGGGAGGYRESGGSSSGCYSIGLPANSSVSALPISIQAYPITVGAGGAGQSTPNSTGARGSNSIFSTITSTGGGGGRDDDVPNSSPTDSQGGSGGGAGGGANPVNLASAGNTPPVSPPQGNPGGAATLSDGNGNQGAGGGGASAAGTDTQPGTTVAPGGAGATSCITASPVTRAGGGGASATPGKGAGAGGPGGGGAGSGAPSGSVGTAGTANTGGGAGGSATYPGGAAAGGSGIVVIRYKFQ